MEILEKSLVVVASSLGSTLAIVTFRTIHAKLLEKMVLSAYTDRAPVPMRVRGEFKSLENGRTLVLVVWKILGPE
jgi:hypothetical protein